MVQIYGITYHNKGEIALLGCNNAPVNALSYSLRLGIWEGYRKAIKDENVKVIVIYGEGRTFPAGADISEFSNGKVFKLPLPKVIDAIENSPKPVIAAIHGTALGGGCELALSCHYRLGTNFSKYGFPEVKLGLLPGSGGTQRAPRVVGPMIAMEMCVSGKQLNAYKAEKFGLIDFLIEVPKGKNELEYLKEQVVYYARGIINKDFEKRRVCNIKCEKIDTFFFDMALETANKTARGHIAPEKIIQAIKAASEGINFKEGLKKESKLFYELAQSKESSALQQTFFAQRAVTKIPGISVNYAQKIRKIGVIGAGTMGGGIAMCFAQKGILVILKEVKQEFLDRGYKILINNWKRSAKKRKMVLISSKKDDKFNKRNLKL